MKGGTWEAKFKGSKNIILFFYASVCLNLFIEQNIYFNIINNFYFLVFLSKLFIFFKK